MRWADVARGCGDCGPTAAGSAVRVRITQLLSGSIPLHHRFSFLLGKLRH